MPTALYSSIQLKDLAISDPTLNARGARSSSVATAQGKPVVLRLPTLRAPFGATSWEDDGRTRKNLDLTDMPPELVAWLRKLDEWCISTATKMSAKLFKSQKTEAEVRGMYVSLAKPGKEGYEPTLRCKANLGGGGVIRVWEQTEDWIKRRELPPIEDWRNARLEAVVSISSLWLQSKSFGLTCTITDAVLECGEAECPF